MVEQKARFTGQRLPGILSSREEQHVVMKKNHRFLLKAIMAALLLPSTIRADQIEDMTAMLSHDSPAAFLVAVKSNRWVAPFIHSKWFVDRITDPDAKQEEVSIRAFGKLMAERLDAWSKTLRDARTAEQIAPLTENLLALSDWLATANGYGNLTLAFRCQDVASTGMGRLAADLNFPYEAVSGLVARLQAPWQSSITRAQMLNAEAGTSLFDVAGIDATTIQERLSKAWQDAQRSIRAQEIRQQSVELLGSESLQTSANKEDPSITAMRKTLESIPQLPSDQMAFFADTPTASYPARPWTTLRLWDIKRHAFFIGGDLESPNLRKLNALLRFRERVGHFPERMTLAPEQVAAQEAEIADAAKKGVRIVPAETAYGSARKAAFATAWRNASTTEPGIGRLACDTYEAILAGDFVDADTHEERLTDQMTTTADPGAR